MKKIIGISGRIGSGKDTLADFMIKELSNFKVERRYFANKIKEFHKELTGIGGYTQEEKNLYLEDFGFTVGEGLQKIGEGLRQAYHKSIWVNSVLTGADKDAYIFLTDIRYPNEADYIKGVDGLLIRLEGDPADVRKNSKRDLTHASETSLDDYKDFDIIYDNNKGLDELELFAKRIVNNFCF